ncbi:MAG: hypothetical protein GY755_12030 [Chloroflexi bacterium]|nr:hypothetical protein [Chloroflexota bacterium]
MMKVNKIASTILLLSLSLSACNMPTNTPPGLSIEEQAGTLAAQTLEAKQNQRPTETQVPANTPTKALPPTPASTATTPPTPTEIAGLPADPSLKKWDFSCSWNGANNDLNVTIEWTDKSSNELGFLIIRNGTEIANLTPNTSQYVDTYAVDTGVTVNYAIQAYNNSGVSGQATFSFAACQ